LTQREHLQAEWRFARRGFRDEVRRQEVAGHPRSCRPRPNPDR
jgi:hypothetical protein